MAPQLGPKKRYFAQKLCEAGVERNHTYDVQGRGQVGINGARGSEEDEGG
jgi:hypothetical protein